MNPFVKNFDELLIRISESPDSVLFINSNQEDCIFEELLIQSMVRFVNGQNVKFIAIRNVKLKPEFKNKGQFTKFIESLISLKRPLLIHDIVNDSLIDFFLKYNFGTFMDCKHDLKMLCMFKINFD
jgi:hypothetical protein